MKILKYIIYWFLVILSASYVSADVIVDLNQQDIFARPGFKHSWLTKLPDKQQPIDSAWVKIPADKSGKRSVIINNIDFQGKKEWIRNSQSKLKTEIFTLVTSFSMSPAVLGKSDFIGLFLSTIGDNWAIYLNGKLLHSEMYLDQQGEITTHRFLRDILIQVDRQLLEEGTNILAFQIAGERADESTGLYSKRSYLLGDYDELLNQQSNIQSIVLAFLYLTMGSFFIFMYAQRTKNFYNLFFGAICLALFFYIISRTIYIQHIVVDSLLITRIEYCSLFSLGALLMIFYDSILGYKPGHITKSYSVYSVLLMILSLTGSSVFINQVLVIWQYTVIIPLLYILLFRIINQMFIDYKEYCKQVINNISVKNWMTVARTLLFSTVAGNLLIGTLIMTIAVSIDVLDTLGSKGNILKTQYAFFIFMMCNAVVLISKFINAQNQAEELTENLESQVRSRTKSLQEANRALINASDKAIQMMQDLEDARDSANKANKAKGEFLSTMSHELRTPMNGVIGMTQLLEDTSLSDEQKEYVTTISTSGDNLLNVINDILDFSKLDADMVKIEAIEFDFERTCQESLMQHSAHLVNKNIELIFDYHPNCPRYFMGDPSRLRQVFANLIGNAVKFTSNGFIGLSVNCIKDTKGDFLRIEVKDTGLGLKTKAIKHLFDEFTQADATTTRKYGGTGLGLAITKKLVMLMGGEIGVDSVYGEGSTFWINIQFPEAEAPEPLSTVSLNNTKILYVDENEDNQTIFKRILDHMEADVSIASDASKVYEELCAAVAKEEPYDIAVIDHNLSDRNVLDLGIEIRKNTDLNDLKLLLFSSIGKKGDTNNFSKAGFNGYLNKPCRYDILRLMLSSLLTQTADQSIITQNSIKDALQLDLAKEDEVGKGVNILLVEDIMTNQVIAKKILSSLGANVDIVDNGQKAVEAYKQNTYDLIFMDCRMPVMDGYEATKTIRKLEKNNKSPKIPIIALTANATNEDRLLCKQSGMDDVVTKPFKCSDLSNSLKKWLIT